MKLCGFVSESFLIWEEKRLGEIIKASEINPMDEDEDVQVELIDATQRDINITLSQHNDDTRDKLNLSYSLAKSPRFQNLTVEKLKEKFGTTNFLTVLSAFLHLYLPGTTITPNNHGCFNAYKQIVISLPSNRYLGEHMVMDRIRTSPSVDASGRALLKAPHFDMAFFVEDLPLYKSDGGISGFFKKRILSLWT